MVVVGCMAVWKECSAPDGGWSLLPSPRQQSNLISSIGNRAQAAWPGRITNIDLHHAASGTAHPSHCNGDQRVRPCRSATIACAHCCRIYQEIGPGRRVALARLALLHYEQTQRPLRLAIDVSIWLFQIQASKGNYAHV